MGREYLLTVPAQAREKVNDVLELALKPLLERLDPRAHEAFPHVFASIVPEGVLLCDNLSDSRVASTILGELIQLLLQYAPSVTVTVTVTDA